MSLVLEAAIFLFAVAASMTQGSGWNAGNYFKISCTTTVMFAILFIACGLLPSRIDSKFSPLLDSPDTIAN